MAACLNEKSRPGAAERHCSNAVKVAAFPALNGEAKWEESNRAIAWRDRRPRRCDWFCGWQQIGRTVTL